MSGDERLLFDAYAYAGLAQAAWQCPDDVRMMGVAERNLVLITLHDDAVCQSGFLRRFSSYPVAVSQRVEAAMATLGQAEVEFYRYAWHLYRDRCDPMISPATAEARERQLQAMTLDYVHRGGEIVFKAASNARAQRLPLGTGARAG